MLAGRGTAEPISPAGVGAYLQNQWMGRRAAEAAASPPVLASPQTEGIADRIMREEQAGFAARNRWNQMAGENLAEIRPSPGAWQRAALPFAPAGFGASEAVTGGIPALMAPTRLPPRPAAPTTVETPQERADRIEAQIAAGPGGGLATQFNRPVGSGELSPIAQYLREVVNAQAGRGEMPAPFRPAQPDVLEGDQTGRIARALNRPEPIGQEQRRAKREAELDIRDRIREGNRIGRPITRQQAQMMAQIEGKAARGEDLTPLETLTTLGPEVQQSLGPQGIAALLEASPSRLKLAEKTAQLDALAQTAGAYAKAGMETPKWIQQALAGIGGGAGGGASEKGRPVTIPGAAPAGGPQGAVQPDQVASINEMAAQLPEDVLDDPLETERQLTAQGADPAAIDAWGRVRYGWAKWGIRHKWYSRTPVFKSGAGIGASLSESGINLSEPLMTVADPFGLRRRFGF